MPAVSDLPPKTPIVCVRPIGDAFGTEGEFILKAAYVAAKHWRERAEWLLQNDFSPDAEPDYDPVPLKIVGKISVHCDFIGLLQPMPYEWDE